MNDKELRKLGRADLVEILCRQRELIDQLDEKNYKVITDFSHDGSTEENALVCWLGSDIPVDNSVLKALYYQALNNQE